MLMYILSSCCSWRGPPTLSLFFLTALPTPFPLPFPSLFPLTLPHPSSSHYLSCPPSSRAPSYFSCGGLPPCALLLPTAATPSTSWPPADYTGVSQPQRATWLFRDATANKAPISAKPAPSAERHLSHPRPQLTRSGFPCRPAPLANHSACQPPSAHLKSALPLTSLGCPR